ncbi:PLP-dependent aminotransferase family protein [Nocardiopsis sp. NPDC058789]|uniref:MocR-like pyridoxine biosynthesis transcription factor PdxR n=1 Tax=Nocardiopsis sp. NPDC058789 TaxID=3346634 RepID=UPI00366ECFD9
MSGANFLQLHTLDVPRGRRVSWLVERVRTALRDGRVEPGTRVPPTRALAEELGVARGTVVEAYRRLTEEGLLTANRGGGTVVSASPPPPTAFRSRDPRAEPDLLDISTGTPDLSAFPRAAWLRAEEGVLSGSDGRALTYAPAQGTLALRTELSSWLARSRGVLAPPDRIIVTGGVTGALALLARVLHDRGRGTVAVEDPGAEGNRRILAHWSTPTVPVRVDQEGLVVHELAASGARTALVTPAHQFPTGVVLSPARRRALLTWAEERDGLVVEDDYDAEYRYDRRPVRALHSMAPERVAHVSSLSKTLGPGLRLGWLVAPSDLHDDLVRARWGTDLGSPVLPQLALAELLRSGALERHLRTMRTRHRRRRDTAVRAVAEHLPGAVVEGVAAGIHLLVLLPEHVDDAVLAERAREEGIRVEPLSSLRAVPGPPGVVVSYGTHPPARLAAAIAVLGGLLRRP